MTAQQYYRGGRNLKPKPREVKIDAATGLVQPIRGVSVYSRPDNLDRFGGAYLLTQLPIESKIIQHGRDPFHFEIVPVRRMTMQEYEQALGSIVPVRV
jgi:hypothetical protein